MNERGVGALAHMGQYVGLPYIVGGRSPLGLDCYGLVLAIYANELGVLLPDWVEDKEIDWDGDRGDFIIIEEPEDYCVVRTPRTSFMPDHFAVYLSGCVFSAQKPSSTCMAINDYLARNPDATFARYKEKWGWN